MKATEMVKMQIRGKIMILGLIAQALCIQAWAGEQYNGNINTALYNGGKTQVYGTVDWAHTTHFGRDGKWKSDKLETTKFGGSYGGGLGQGFDNAPLMFSGQAKLGIGSYHRTDTHESSTLGVITGDVTFNGSAGRSRTVLGAGIEFNRLQGDMEKSTTVEGEYNGGFRDKATITLEGGLSNNGKGDHGLVVARVNRDLALCTAVDGKDRHYLCTNLSFFATLGTEFSTGASLGLKYKYKVSADYPGSKYFLYGGVNAEAGTYYDVVDHTSGAPQKMMATVGILAQ